MKLLIYDYAFVIIEILRGDLALRRGKEKVNMNSSFVIKGHICHTPEANRMEIRENACVVCEAGVCRGVFDAVPERYGALDVIDCRGMLVMPGMVDLHTHAPQYAFCGTGMDYELLTWLIRVTFPEELKYADAEYAAAAYDRFAQMMAHSATTRAVIFGTRHAEATLMLMDRMEKSGLVSYVGKVNMDRCEPMELAEPSAAEAAADTRRFIEGSLRRGYRRTRPIVTPRFVPSCSDALLAALGELRRTYGLPVQSHLSENPDEVELVRELAPWSAFYGDVYDHYGLFGGDCNTVMAHCVHSVPQEVQRLRDNGVWVAHCPSSNMNLGSGIAPIRRYMEQGLRVGLATDVAAGTSPSMFRATTDAIQLSKLYRRCVDGNAGTLTFPEGFYLATKGGGSFFGKVGSFEEGYAFDALVLDDSAGAPGGAMSVRDRLERAFYLELDRNCIVMKFADGERIFQQAARP